MRLQRDGLARPGHRDGQGRESLNGPHAETPIRVGIGLIARDGRYLVRIRPPGSPMPGVWEFPGGKCEPGETPEAATARECREEVGMVIRVGRLDRTITHRYPHGLVELSYFHCRPESAECEPAPDSGFLWVAARDLAHRRFPEANEGLIADLACSDEP
ncbi:(deoxy)nucleoside triphosphate pyrophosphohydrolase [Tundrisphaera sp. TA3]|uniref:(deoxy)nucleoside triphosphate pyrophosphohydrolase n=1 Tax=Tundrisphaera sp. TA3 TaxID=3435775 RepID=UPI003EB8A7DD